MEIEPLTLEDLINVLVDNKDTTSLEYQAAQKLKELRDAFQVGIDLAGVVSYAEIMGCVTHNRISIRRLCDEVYAIHTKLEME